MKKKKGRKIIKVTAVTVCFLLIAAIAGAVMFSINVGKQVAEGLLYLNEGKDTKENSVKQLETWNYDLAGFEAAYEPEKRSVTAEDGVVSPGAVFDMGGKKTAVLLHGLGGDYVSTYPIAELYLKKGFNVIAVDQRASGDSPDNKVSFGYFEKLDAAAWVDYAKNELKSENVVIHGQSMGAATAALYAATEHAAQNVEAVILDSCFDSMENMFLDTWRSMEGTEGIPEDYILACGDWYLNRHYGFGFEDTDIMEKMKENRVSTLMLQSTKDDMVSNETAEQMFENCAAEKKKICYFDSRHIEGLIDFKEEYEEAVFSFLNS